ncbi:uncharacterized protein BDZ99DRAFT_517590 [Mytilinidion resinicola]|uniref:GPI anchored protein n=1 Tax=Mytilinidion resinicola TaxID=574789 RepID=A0A6A6YXU6_9PEZI|nr:uncharacterized protein BDZ99DRAFT_517590 [Mytilinidion resinicola]KAF2813319.1 hypothetical protein BDZ99DRAFT_517590 [Mytilinidion resinicola]
MHFKTVALMALASVAIASPNADLANRQASSVVVNPTEASVLSVLLTALPSSLLQIAITNQAEVGSIIASSFSAGETPGWYSALPNDVKSYLPILYAEQTPTSTSTSTPTPSSSSIASSTPAPSSSSSVLTVISTAVGTVSATISPSGNGTVISTVHSPTLSATSAGSESSIASASASASASAAASSTQTGGASYPTAVMGAGIAGALGFLGMLAM